MLELKKIAVTGGLGAGKTLVCTLLSELGAFIVSADELAHQCLISDNECIHKIELLFGSEIKTDHQIDRKKLARLVFSDAEKLDLLERILHPVILKKMEALYEEACVLKISDLFVVEVPLLFEAKWERFFDITIVVFAEKPLCQERARAKGLNAAEYALRSKRLLSADEQALRADYIVYNNTSEEDLRKQIVEIIKTIKSVRKNSNR